jgi:acyl dehydratase
LDPRLNDRVIQLGETIAKTVRVPRDEIAAFAQMSHDENPLHTDARVAQRARFGEIIASGQHTASILMGMLATHFSRHDDGIYREMLFLNMNFSFKGPVFADRDVRLQWRVSAVQWNSKLEGLLAHLDGAASIVEGKPLVIARGTILVKEVPA